jgi:hypothetical protein
MNVESVARAINETKVAEVVSVTVNPNGFHIMHRVEPKRLSLWLNIISHVLARKEGWSAHICKHYFLNGEGALRHALMGSLLLSRLLDSSLRRVGPSHKLITSSHPTRLLVLV